MLEGREKMERIKCLHHMNVKIKNPHNIQPGLTMSTERLVISPFVGEIPHRCKTSERAKRFWCWCLLLKSYRIKTLVSNSPLIDYFNHNHKKPVFISMRICLLQHVTHTNFHWGHTYPSWGMRTRALGRSSTEELTIVSLKSPSGWATWQKKKKKEREREKGQNGFEHLKRPTLQSLLLSSCLHTCPSMATWLPYRLIAPISSQNELFLPLAHVNILTWSNREASTTCAPVPKAWWFIQSTQSYLTRLCYSMLQSLMDSSHIRCPQSKFSTSQPCN